MPLRAKIDSARLSQLGMYSTASTEAADEILVRTNGAVREIQLNRPRKLNAISKNMCEKMAPRLVEYAKSDSAHIVVVKGGEKAFSAGGDVAALALTYKNNGAEAGRQASYDYFATEFKLNHLIATYPKPYVALTHGFVMGGGVGLSTHAPFRVATEKTVWSMPETTIGYFPDVGGLFYLSRMDGFLGLYLALTSDRLSGYEAYRKGASTHFINSSRLPALEQRLTELTPPEGKKSTDKAYFDLVNQTLNEFSASMPVDYQPTITAANMRTINNCFKHDKMESILAALEKDGSEFAQKALKTMSVRSPSSMKITLAAFHVMAKQDIKSALHLEQRIADAVCCAPDFEEGVIARLVEKREPTWTPATLAEVSDAQAASIASGAASKVELIEFFNDRTFTEYPHKYALPSVRDVQLYVTGETSDKETKATKDEVLRHFSKTGKEGVAEHVSEILEAYTTCDPSDNQYVDWVY